MTAAILALSAVALLSTVVAITSQKKHRPPALVTAPNTTATPVSPRFQRLNEEC